jgi:hypothetical protein
MKPRTPAQTFALVLLGAGLSTLASVLLFDVLSDRRDRKADAPLPGTIVPGHSSA